MLCPNPKCHHNKYKTVKSEGYFNMRLRTLKCKRCGHQWKTEEKYNQTLDAEVLRVDKTSPYYNTRLRYIRAERQVIMTHEIMTENNIQFMNLDLFAEAI